MPNLQLFGLEFENNIVIFEISTLEFVLTAKLRKKTKMLKFGTKIPYLGNFGLEFENNIVIFETSTLEFV